MGRKQNDVFVLGGESLHAEQPDSPEAGGETGQQVDGPGGETLRLDPSGGSLPPTAGKAATRRLAALGLLATAAASLGAVALFGAGGSEQAPRRPTTSSASAAVGEPTSPRVTPPRRAASHRPRVRKPRPGGPGRAHRNRHRHELPRETTLDQAPVSSTIDVPAPVPPPAPAGIPLPPSPPPIAIGARGGSGGREEFGFER